MIPVGRSAGAIAWAGSLLLHGAIVLAATLISDSWISLIRISGEEHVARIDSAFSNSSARPTAASLFVEDVAQNLAPMQEKIDVRSRVQIESRPDPESLRDLQLPDVSTGLRLIQTSTIRATRGRVVHEFRPIDSSVSRSLQRVNEAIESNSIRSRSIPAERLPEIEPPIEPVRPEAATFADFRPVPVPQVFDELAVAAVPVKAARTDEPGLETDRSDKRATTAAQSSQSLPAMAGSTSERARPQFTPAPQYPVESIRLREQGRVLLRVWITAQGVVSKTALVQSSGFTRLDQAARETVTAWQFRPATQDGVPIATEVQIPIRFEL